MPFDYEEFKRIVGPGMRESVEKFMDALERDMKAMLSCPSELGLGAALTELEDAEKFMSYPQSDPPQSDETKPDPFDPKNWGIG